MSKISDGRIEKIKEEVLRILYECYPEFKYTYEISDSMLRDDQFILKLLHDLKKISLVTSFEESKGRNIKRKWSLTKPSFEKYKELIGD